MKLPNISENCQAPFCIIYQLHTIQFIAGRRQEVIAGDRRGPWEQHVEEKGNSDSILLPSLIG